MSLFLAAVLPPCSVQERPAYRPRAPEEHGRALRDAHRVQPSELQLLSILPLIVQMHSLESELAALESTLAERQSAVVHDAELEVAAAMKAAAHQLQLRELMQV